jgi:hypothetical protein
MMKNWKGYVLGAAIVLMVLPVWAKPKSERTDTADWSPMQPVTVGQTEIQPGDYTLKAQESGTMLEVVRDGKVVAEVPCHWVELPKKASNTEVDTYGNTMTKVEFAGRIEALQIG